MKKKKIGIVIGIVALTFVLVTNLQYALTNYGLGSNRLGSNLWAQSGTSSTVGSNWFQENLVSTVYKSQVTVVGTIGITYKGFTLPLAGVTYTKATDPIAIYNTCGSISITCDKGLTGLTTLPSN